MAQKIREVMTGPPVTVAPDMDLVGAARKMRDENIGAVLVTENDTLRGVVTDRDLVVRGLAENGDPSVTVRSVCSGADVTVGPDDDVMAAVKLMREHSVRRVAVVDGGRPVGIVSLGDLAMERDENSALADISAAKPDQ
jgi:CBS domain-containing protein